MFDEVLALAVEHRLAGQATVALDLVRAEPFITYEALGEDLGVDTFREAADFAPRVMHYAQSPIMLLSLVGAGLGIATVPVVLKDTAPPGVTFVNVDRSFSELPNGATHVQYRGLTRSVASFCCTMRSRCCPNYEFL